MRRAASRDRDRTGRIRQVASPAWSFLSNAIPRRYVPHRAARPIALTPPTIGPWVAEPSAMRPSDTPRPTPWTASGDTGISRLRVAHVSPAYFAEDSLIGGGGNPLLLQHGRLALADGLLSISDFARSLVRAYFRGPHAAIIGPVDTSAFTPPSQSSPSSGGARARCCRSAACCRTREWTVFYRADTDGPGPQMEASARHRARKAAVGDAGSARPWHCPKLDYVPI